MDTHSRHAHTRLRQILRFEEWNAVTPAADPTLERGDSARSMEENTPATTYWAEDIQGVLEVDHDDLDDSDGECDSLRLETIPSMDMMHSDSLGLSESELSPSTSDAAKRPLPTDSKEDSNDDSRDDDDALPPATPNLSSSSSTAPGEDQESVSVPAANDAIPS